MWKSSACVLVEGVCGSGKSTLIDGIAVAMSEHGASLVVMSQKDTYGPIAPLEDAGCLDDQRNVEVLRDVVAGARIVLEDGPVILLIDTLHLTQAVRPGVLSAQSFHEIDASLASIGARVVFLVAKEETIRRRTIDGRRGTGFAGYAARFGATDDELVAHFAREQRTMRRIWTERSELDGVVLDADLPRDVLREQAIGQLLGWLDVTRIRA